MAVLVLAVVVSESREQIPSQGFPSSVLVTARQVEPHLVAVVVVQQETERLAVAVLAVTVGLAHQTQSLVAQ
jgi:hypothetical protein